MKRYSWGVWSIILLFVTKCSEKPILQSFLCKTEAEGHLLPSLFLQINFRLGAFGQKSTRSNTFEHRSFDESCFLYIFNLCLIFFFFRGRVFGVVEIPHLRRRLRRQLLHAGSAGGGGDASPLPAAGRRGGRAREGRRPRVRPRRRRRQGRPASLARSLAPSLPPAPARRALPHTLTRGATRTPPAPQPRRLGPLKRQARAARRRACSCGQSPGRGGRDRAQPCQPGRPLPAASPRQ